MSTIVCANAAWRFPMTLIGKSHGKARSVGVSCSGMSRGTRARLVVLEELVHPRIDRSRLPGPDPLAVDGDDRQNLARGGGQPDLVRAVQLRPLHLARLEPQPGLARELEREVESDSVEDEVVLGRNED